MDVVPIVAVVIDGFAAVPVRFDAAANIFPKISRAAGIGGVNWKFLEEVWRKGNRLGAGKVFRPHFRIANVPVT